MINRLDHYSVLQKLFRPHTLEPWVGTYKLKISGKLPVPPLALSFTSFHLLKAVEHLARHMLSPLWFNHSNPGKRQGMIARTCQPRRGQIWNLSRCHACLHTTNFVCLTGEEEIMTSSTMVVTHGPMHVRANPG